MSLRCWICAGQLDTITDGDGNTYNRCPTCQPRLAALEDVAERAAGLAILALRAKVAPKLTEAWEKVCASCSTPIATNRKYCDKCREPMRKARARDYGRNWMRKKRASKK